jgi:hypothetical protein
MNYFQIGLLGLRNSLQIKYYIFHLKSMIITIYITINHTINYIMIKNKQFFKTRKPYTIEK